MFNLRFQTAELQVMYFSLKVIWDSEIKKGAYLLNLDMKQNPKLLLDEREGFGSVGGAFLVIWSLILPKLLYCG